VPKPWGSINLHPWSDECTEATPIGEIWFERSGVRANEPALLLKLLFTQQPLSIQVHPDDRYARSLGLPHGKTEAWYVLSAEPGAQVALGLKWILTSPELRRAILDGSIEDLVQWRTVTTDDVISIPAGTIHAIGPGLVLAEIQQASDTTFRLFDFGRGRELHIDHAVAVADAKPAHDQPVQRRLSSARLLLAVSPHFILERIELVAGTAWELRTGGRETWLLVLEGQARAGRIDVKIGDALFLDAYHTGLTAGATGLKALVAYVGGEPSPDLLQSLDAPSTDLSPFGPFPPRPSQEIPT
jgi:mannose-6-phosphate isomerase